MDNQEPAGDGENRGLSEEQFMADPATPRWIKDISRFLPVKSQFVLTGNIRDRYPFPLGGDKYLPMTLTQYLTECLRIRGYEHFVSYRPGDGFRVVSSRGDNPIEQQAFFRNQFGMQFDETGKFACSLREALNQIRRIVEWKDNLLVVYYDFASRYAIRSDALSETEHDFYTQSLILSHETVPHTTPGTSLAQFNSVFWICDKENDLPTWFAMDNPRIRSVVVPRPDHHLRRALIGALLPALEGYTEGAPEAREECQKTFVEQTEAMVLTDVIAITQLCRREKLPFDEIGEAVRRYKLGVTEDPWRKLDRAKIVGGEEFIRRRVKGQSPAVIKSLDIIKRAVIGLSGSQGSKIGGKPRGVLFFAGPTGVGKTELAKSITELLFSDERAYIRFDMSEFNHEHADQRLLGAPPGYVGYDAGGELTNAIREKPFSVVLFDEIEKANPKILDKFLQLLDDGVLTSGRGERVYFSESVIIFTSNLGIYRIGDDGKRVLNISPDDPYPDVEARVRSEIEKYFKETLGRPEILNRIGENIVVFDFIRSDVAELIFGKMFDSIRKQLLDRQGISLTISDDAKATLRTKCVSDLSNGGRGIGNQLEKWFVNPLGRALFDANVPENSEVAICALEERDGVPQVIFDMNKRQNGEPS